ncbi:MAG: hypothetical protein IJL32_09180 [Oscillospiraceae bacterium]|nr:hypothetical protein [Oscillospiraceae bacterium]MBQ9905227.1 hypothetical protein [Oscillospiraceae bacterium]
MLEMKADGTVVEIEAKGTMSDLLSEYAYMTASLMHSFLKPCNTDSEYKRIAEMMTGAFCAGMKQAMDRRRKEVLHESTE